MNKTPFIYEKIDRNGNSCTSMLLLEVSKENESAVEYYFKPAAGQILYLVVPKTANNKWWQFWK